jgi:very-short-patch-repair endonuclease
MKQTPLALFQLAGLEGPLEEYRFHPKRRWRFDFAWPQRRLAVELEGGIFVHGRHVRARGYDNDCEKYNEAQLLGWRVLRFTSCMIQDGRALALLERACALTSKKGKHNE